MSDSKALQIAGVTAPAYLDHPSTLPLTLDMGAVWNYEHMIEDLSMVNSMNGPLYMREFLKAKELVSSIYSKLILDYERAKNETKKQYALAYLERSQDYIKARSLKDTDETKKQYVQIDNHYQKAKDEEDALRAMITLIGNKVDKFQNAYEATKKIFENSSDPRGSRVGMPVRSDEA